MARDALSKRSATRADLIKPQQRLGQGRPGRSWAWCSPVMFVLLFAVAGCRPASSTTADLRPSPRADAVTGLLQGGSDGFAVADRPPAMQFPRDHLPHPQYRTEWWYFTGHLQAADGRQFGFQYTVFRQALRPPGGVSAQVPGGASAWRTDTAWLAHLALTDIQLGEHAGHARIARGSMGLGGLVSPAAGPAQQTVSAEPSRAHAMPGNFALVVDGWRMQRSADGAFLIQADSADGAFLIQAESADGAFLSQAASADADDSRAPAGANTESGDIGLRLRLVPVSEPVLHGRQGWSRKGPSSASYYYSIPRWQVAGAVRTTAGEWVQVRGDGWLDREWSTSALAPEQVGWDWFSLRLGQDQDGRDRALMLFRLRRSDCRRDAFDSGTLVTGNVAQALTGDDFALTPVEFWQDEAGRRWPVRWTLTLRKPALRLEIRAVLADQLMRVGLVYWEGAVNVDGDAKGRGYLEMTGYTAVADRAD